MKASFGSELKKFALNIDNVPGDVYDKAMQNVQLYLNQSLSISSFGLLVEGRNGRNLALLAVWHPGGGPWANNLKNEDGSYDGQVAYAYDVADPLWIVSNSEDKELARTNLYINLWDVDSSPEAEIPMFVQNHDQPTRTSIILPLFSDDSKRKPFGVLNLETTEYLVPNEDIKKELISISEAVSRLYEFNKLHQKQNSGTIDILNDLDRIAQRPLVLKRSVFLASSSKADDEVIGLIKEVLDKDFPDVIVIYWKDEFKPGNITDQIWTKLLECQLGLCYLSEKTTESATESKDHQYHYNSNVLFESGIMEALKNTDTGIFREWIPIREDNSPQIPFNFSTNRSLTVTRSEDNSIKNAEAFRKNLRKMVSDVFKS